MKIYERKTKHRDRSHMIVKWRTVRHEQNKGSPKMTTMIN